MTSLSRHTLALVVAACCTSMLVTTPTAAADPALDANGGSAQAVIDDLEARGYLVQINWLNGFDTKPLSVCTVTGVNDPGDLPPGTTVYVDVICPNHED